MPQTYSDFVAFRSQDNPCTARLSAFLEPGLHRPQGSCKIDIVDYQGDNVSHYAKLSASDLTPSHLEPPPTGQGRVVMVEDLHPAVLEVLATTLDIDPLFFAEYLFTRYDDIEISPAPPSSALPPSWALSNASSFHIHFQQAVSLSRLDGATKKWPWTLRTVGNVDRSVRRMIDLQPGRQLGLLRGCCSVLKRVFDRSWIGKLHSHELASHSPLFLLTVIEPLYSSIAQLPISSMLGILTAIPNLNGNHYTAAPKDSSSPSSSQPSNMASFTTSRADA